MIDVLEAMLRPPALTMAPYPPKSILLASGETMVVRPAARDEIDVILTSIEPLIKLKRDFYDIVAARLYAELLGWKVHRVRNEYCLVGVVDGELAGVVNGRMFDEKHGISYHTLALRRGVRVGAHLFASKMEYHIEHLKQRYVYITAESPIGFRRWMLEYDLTHRPDISHELGGVDVWTLTPELYFAAKERLVVGERPVPDELMESARTVQIPTEAQLVKQVTGKEKKRSS